MTKDTNQVAQSNVAADLIKARVLRDHCGWLADDVVLLTAEELKPFVASAIVDANPRAVEYAESLKKNGGSK